MEDQVLNAFAWMLMRLRLIQAACSALTILLLIAATDVYPAVSAAETADSWLPLKRSQLINILSLGTETNPPTTQTLEEYAVQKRSSDSLAAAERLAPDTIWLIYGPEFPFFVALAGDGERVHSLRIIVQTVGQSKVKSERAFRALSDLFTTIYPEAPDAATWPQKSLATAWNNHPLARKAPLADPDDVFVRRSASGITSSTFGVPPDIVVYDITVRKNCIPVSDHGNPFPRIIC